MKEKIKFLLYLSAKDNNGKLNWIKSIRNIMLMCVAFYYIEIILNVFNQKRGFFAYDEISNSIVFWGYALGGVFVTLVIFALCLFKNKIIWSIKFFLFLLSLYIYRNITLHCFNPICYLNPFWYIPLFFSFILIFNQYKYFNQILIIFVLIPSCIIINEDIVGRIKINDFYEKCNNEIIEAKYNPLYLPQEYFHKDVVNGKEVLKPNILEYSDYGKYEIKEKQKAIVFFAINQCDIDEVRKINIANKDKYTTLCVFNSFDNLIINQIDKDYKTTNVVLMPHYKTSWHFTTLSLILNTKRKTYSCSSVLSHLDDLYNFIPIDNYIKVRLTQKEK